MKIKINEIELIKSFDDSVYVEDYLVFLSKIGVLSNLELRSELFDALNEFTDVNFCGDCENHHDDCDCYRERHREYNPYDDEADFDY